MFAMKPTRFDSHYGLERPALKCRHLVGVRSNFLVYRLRHGEYEDLYVGRRDDKLRRSDNDYGWLIVEREITLDQTVLLGGGIGFFF